MREKRERRNQILTRQEIVVQLKGREGLDMANRFSWLESWPLTF